MTGTPREETIQKIITEFSQVFAGARTRWARLAEEVHPELRGIGMMMLQTIGRCERITATELGTILDMDKAAVSRQIARLRELGLVEATPDAEDRRVWQLTASELAKNTLDELRRRSGDDYHVRFAEWNEGDLRELQRLLNLFNGA